MAAGIGRQWIKYFDADTITRLSHIGFKPSGLVEGHLVGNHRSPFHGFAIEFAGHRQYVPGDDLKHLDWRAYSRTERFLIKQYEQETNFNAYVVMDVSASMAFDYESGRKLDYGAFIAAALSQVVINQSDTVGAFFFDNQIREEIRPGGTDELVAKLSDVCEHIEPKGAAAIGDVLCLLAERIGRRQVVFVISDFFGDPAETFRGVKRLLDDKHEVVLFQLVDPLERDFDIPGKVRLLDLEGEARMDLVGHHIRDSYAEVFGEFLDEMRRESLNLGIDYLLCGTDRSFGLHLAEYLSRRQVMA